MFLARDITRHDLRELVRRCLRETRGRYKDVLTLFGMPSGDYRRFMNFLAAHECGVEVREFREAAASPKAPGNAAGVFRSGKCPGGPGSQLGYGDGAGVIEMLFTRVLLLSIPSGIVSSPSLFAMM